MAEEDRWGATNGKVLAERGLRVVQRGRLRRWASRQFETQSRSSTRTIAAGRSLKRVRLPPPDLNSHSPPLTPHHLLRTRHLFWGI
eukprot:1104215-Rhodomonas_salina.4